MMGVLTKMYGLALCLPRVGNHKGCPYPAKTRYSFWRRSRFRTLPTGLRGKPGTTSNRSGSL